jgi:curved DNA-binding protein CbpA
MEWNCKMNKVRTHYDNLKVSENAPIEVITAAYRSLSKMYHPDTNKREDAERILKIINKAYEVLSDEQKRREHDLWIEKMELAYDAKREQEKAEPVCNPSGYIPPGEPTIINLKKITVAQKDRAVIKSLLVLFALALGSVMLFALSGGLKKKEEAPAPAPAQMTAQTSEYNEPNRIEATEAKHPTKKNIRKKKLNVATAPAKDEQSATIFKEEKIDDTSEPEINIKNDSYANISLKIGTQSYEISSKDELKMPFTPGNYKYHASATGVRSKSGEINIKQGYRYSWKFWIVAGYVP